MISPHALIDPSAKIAKNVEIGPWTAIGPEVEIDEGTWISSHVVIKGPAKIGKNNKIFQFASIGEQCQDSQYKGERTELVIGDNNIFREGCTVHRGTAHGKGRKKTTIGNDNFFMANTHVAHDCIVGNNVIFAYGASIAGHVVVQDHAILGGLAGVHQYCTIGSYSFATGGAIIYKDILPYMIASGYPAKIHGINVVGLRRHEFSSDVIALIKQAYKIIFRSEHTVKEVKEKLKELSEGCKEILILIDFLNVSQRGLAR